MQPNDEKFKFASRNVACNGNKQTNKKMSREPATSPKSIRVLVCAESFWVATWSAGLLAKGLLILKS